MMARIGKFIFTGFLFLGVSTLTHAAFVTNLSDTKIQTVLENYFPISEYAAFARVSLQKPKVRLQKNNKSIMLIVPVVANVAGGVVHRGHATFSVKLTYKSPTGGLYLSQPEIQQFEIPGVDKKMLTDLREIVNSMGANSLPIVRIYTVKEHELNHSLAKSTLKSSAIENGKLRLEFGFN